MHGFGSRFIAGLITALVAWLALAGQAQAQWQARHGLTPAQYQATFDDLVKQGYRLQSVSGYVSGGERYAALFVKSSGPAWEARHGLSAADYQKTFDDLVKQGYRLTWVSAHEASGALHVPPTGRCVGVAGIRSVLTGRNDHE